MAWGQEPCTPHPRKKRIYTIHSNNKSQTNEVEVTSSEISFLFALTSSKVWNRAISVRKIANPNCARSQLPLTCWNSCSLSDHIYPIMLIIESRMYMYASLYFKQSAKANLVFE